MTRTTPPKTHRLRPSPEMLVACAALFVALGGVGYAATTIGSEQIRNNSIESADVRDGSLLSRDLSDGTILPRDLHPSALDIQNDTILSRDIQDDTILSRDIQDDTILSRDIAAATIQQRDISPAALSDFEGPRAFAHVFGHAPGTVPLVDELNSKGITNANVTNPEEGVYCFDNLGFDPKIVIATFEFSDLAFTEDVVVRALAVEDSINNYSPPLDQKCLGDEQASVRLVGRENGTPINGRFYVMFE